MHNIVNNSSSEDGKSDYENLILPAINQNRGNDGSSGNSNNKSVDKAVEVNNKKEEILPKI